MLSVRPKITGFSFRLFRRSLHPELFQVHASRRIQRMAYDIRVQITSGGHLVTLTSLDGVHPDASNGPLVLNEVVCSSQHPLPRQQELLAMPLSGDHEQRARIGDQIRYRCRVQLDPTEPKTFLALQHELMHATECDGLLFEFGSSGRLAVGAVSYVHVVSRERTINVRAFHTFPDAHSVLKCESTFELLQ